LTARDVYQELAILCVPVESTIPYRLAILYTVELAILYRTVEE